VKWAMSESSPAYLAARVPAIVALFKQRHGGDAIEILEQFHESKVYADLIDDKTGVELFSTPLIVELYEEELCTGTYDYPEVV
jgi:hypothetical protein